MLKSKVAGVIFAQNEQSPLDALIRHRVIASVPYGGRYRVVDFILSAMSNSGMTNVSMIVNSQYHSLFDHIGSGKEWNLSRKGDNGLSILLPFSQGSGTIIGSKAADNYLGTYLRDLIYFKNFFMKMENEYIIFSRGNIIANLCIDDIVENHCASGKDVTVVCTDRYIGEPRFSTYISKILSTEKYSISIHPSQANGLESLGVVMMSRVYLLELLERASKNLYRYSDSDIFRDLVDGMTMNAYVHIGFAAKINTIREYYNANMKLLEKPVRDELFSQKSPIYTKLRDEKPAIYKDTSCVKNSLVSDGCIIRGRVENSILFRTVTVEEGAVVKDCILMSDTIIERGVSISHVITDKKARITKDSSLVGTAVYPVVIEKNATV